MQKPTVLVVDDSKLMRRAITKLLGKEYQYIEAVDGEDGFNKLVEHKEIGLVFSDLSMPNMNGYELLDTIRANKDERISSMPVVIITGAEDDDDSKQQAIEHGASDFISKPFNSAQVKARAETHIKLDVTTKDLNTAKQVIKETSTIDALTGLANKRFYATRSEECLAFCRRHHVELAIARIDIGGFNKIYTSYGKEAANHIIVSVANVLKGCMRREDTAARIGMAKFALVLPSTNKTGATAMCDRICHEILSKNYEFGGFNIEFTINIGASVVTIGARTDVNDFTDSAEKYLVNAIAMGSNNIVINGELLDETDSDESDDEYADSVIETTHRQQGIDELLKSIEEKNKDKVLPHLKPALKRLLPLLRLANKRLQLDADDFINRLEEKLD